jgi:bacteriorhodopsin
MAGLNDNSYSDALGGAALWTGFGFQFFATVVFLGITLLNDKPKNAAFNYLATTIVAISALAYLVEALGNTEMDTVRPLLWIRYAQWATNTPLIVIALGLLAGITYTEAFFATALSLITTAALFAAAISTGYNATWPIYVFGIVAALPVVYLVLFVWASRVASAGKSTAGIYTFLAWFSFFLSVGYAVNWGTAEGGKVQSTDQEVITYTVLDILTRVVFGFVLLFSPGAIEGANGFLTVSGSEVVKTVEESAASPATV